MTQLPDVEWDKLPFGYHKTDYNVRIYFREGRWSDVEVSTDEYINLHMAATCLHYGQEIFEGLKAFRGIDGKVRLFRARDNGQRMYDSAKGLLMEPVPVDLFCRMAEQVVKLNERWIPPYESGCSLYLRPLMIGTSPQVGVRRATEYMFIIFVTPVGPYFKEGFNTTKVAILRGYDRAAPKGTGRFKTGGNYAGGLMPSAIAREQGFSAVLFLDPREKKYIDECGPANFFAIKDGTYITPKSDSILPSVTNRSFQQIAKDMGLKVECRPMLLEELRNVDEAAECGTAAVAAPISEVHDLDTDECFVIARDGKPGPVTTELYRRLRAIQSGEAPDTHGWCTIID